MICSHCQTPLGLDARFCPACGQQTIPTETQADVSGPIRQQNEMVGREIAGRLRLFEKLGEGGMGAVYRGEQISLKRRVAVKVLRPELSANQMVVRRFAAEAEAVAKLDHPNTVRVYDSGQDTDGALFIAMEFIDGKSLRSVIGAQGPLLPSRAIAIGIQVAASLIDAHSQGITHRDLKPDNVMLQDKGRQRDVVRVLDFGIAKLRDDSRSTQHAMTQAGDMLGTPQYMAPEQIRGDAIDGRTDIYALGCMIYEMVTARLPYEAPTVLAMLTKHLTDVVVPPSQRRPDLGLPPQIDQVVLAAMGKEPAQRPATMEQYADMLAAVLQTLPPDPNRSVQLSQAQAVILAAPTPASPTPAPHSFTPQPQVYAPTPAGLPPVYTPPAAYAPISPTTHLPRARSRMPIYIVLGVIAAGGAGVGVWASQQGSGTPAKHDDPHTGSAPVVAKQPGSDEEGKDKDDEKDNEQIIPIPSAGPDPWGATDTPSLDHKRVGRPATPDTPPSAPTVTISTAETPIPPNARLDMPQGFTHLEAPNTIAYLDQAHSTTVALAPVYGGTNDIDQLSAHFIRDMSAQGGSMTVAQKTSRRIAGATRPVVVFTGMIGTTPVTQLAILFLTPQYRLAFLMQAPTALFIDPQFQKWGDNYIANGIHLP